jgi:SAM-dependent methyltransferase
VNRSAKVEERPAAADTSHLHPTCIVRAERGYERWAPLYDDSPNPLLAREERYLLPLIERLTPTRALDLGCGTGRWLEKLESFRFTRTGMDRSAAMLRRAQAKPGTAGQLIQADCENLPFSDAAFDLALCSFTVGHVEDLVRMAKELARVTQSGADLFVSDLHPAAYEGGWRVGFRDNSSAVEIAIVPRSSETIVETFECFGFRCRENIALRLEEPERVVFERAGKIEMFLPAIKVPAILSLHFTRSAQSAGPSA